jgi:predicted metal-dependent hydrolase
VLIILIVVISIACFAYSFLKVSVISKIDGRYYTVKNNSLKQSSADLLASVNKNLLQLIRYANKESYSKNLQKYDPAKIHENIMNFDTTYTTNKSSMVFCISPRTIENTTKLYDINTMMYVAIHELAHIASDSVGHTDEFKRNFADLLKKGIEIGVYRYIDYNKEPVEYCGIKLTKSILN